MNLQNNYSKAFHHTLNVYTHYLVKIENKTEVESTTTNQCSILFKTGSNFFE